MKHLRHGTVMQQLVLQPSDAFGDAFAFLALVRVIALQNASVHVIDSAGLAGRLAAREDNRR